MRKINVGTVFSGIGSPEQALERLNMPHRILFACDNGERIINIDSAKELSCIKNMATPREKKEYVDNLYNSHSRQNNYVQQFK